MRTTQHNVQHTKDLAGLPHLVVFLDASVFGNLSIGVNPIKEDTLCGAAKQLLNARWEV